jgi:uncharacterized protein with HEPN domain
MRRRIGHRLRDIVTAAEFAAQYDRALNSQQLAAAAKERDAVLYQLAVIGEAVSHLPAEILALAPEVPWTDIKSTRNIIIHSYWQVDMVAIARVVAVDLGPLTAAVERLIAITESDA